MGRQSKPQIALRYEVTGQVTEHRPANGDKFTLAELQRLVGGYLETVICRLPRCVAYVDEEGALKRLAANPKTWAVLKRETYALNGYAEGWRVSGPILLVGRTVPTEATL